MTRPSRSPSPKISSVDSDVDGKLVIDQKLLTERTKAAVAALHSICGHRSGVMTVNGFSGQTCLPEVLPKIWRICVGQVRRGGLTSRNAAPRSPPRWG